MYHRDAVRSGYDPRAPRPDRLSILWTTQLDGAVYADAVKHLKACRKLARES